MKLTGVKLKMSTLYHPETDGSSEISDKTINQMLQYHVCRNQKGWLCALPCIRFQIMNSVNASTKFSGFQLHLGRSLRIIPPLVTGSGEATMPNPTFLPQMSSIVSSTTWQKPAITCYEPKYSKRITRNRLKGLTLHTKLATASCSSRSLNLYPGHSNQCISCLSHV